MYLFVFFFVIFFSCTSCSFWCCFIAMLLRMCVFPAFFFFFFVIAIIIRVCILRNGKSRSVNDSISILAACRMQIAELNQYFAHIYMHTKYNFIKVFTYALTIYKTSSFNNSNLSACFFLFNFSIVFHFRAVFSNILSFVFVACYMYNSVLFSVFFFPILLACFSLFTTCTKTFSFQHLTFVFIYTEQRRTEKL